LCARKTMRRMRRGGRRRGKDVGGEVEKERCLRGKPKPLARGVKCRKASVNGGPKLRSPWRKHTSVIDEKKRRYPALCS